MVLENTDLSKVISLLENKENVFLTGYAGTGKSYILQELKKRYKSKLILTSTTGISAYNIGGSTIHSWAKVGCMDAPIEDIIEELKFSQYRIKYMKNSILAIDEISMLSAYELEYLDEYFRLLRENDSPFGGIQVLFIGDFLQLPPVATNQDLKYSPTRANFCFESPVWEKLDLQNVVLKKIYRQTDFEFARTLCNFRIGILKNEHMELLSTRFVKNEEYLDKKLHIFPKKIQVDAHNKKHLEEIDSSVVTYKQYDKIPVPDNVLDEKKYKHMMFHTMNRYLPVEAQIDLKVGCRVMLLVNMDVENGLVNGSCGHVVELNPNDVIVNFDNGIVKKIRRSRFSYKENGKELASRFQIPLKLAYAITIHKSQGMTFDEVVIDCSDSFAAGQVYVGLSRVRTLNGLYILGLNPKKVYADNNAKSFYINLAKEQNDKEKNLLFRKYV